MQSMSHDEVEIGIGAISSRAQSNLQSGQHRSTRLEQSHPAQALALVALGEDQMVDHGKVDCFGRAGEGAGGAAVGGARGRVAAGMVVREQDSRAAEPSGIGDNFAHRQIHRALMPLGIAAKVDATRTLVDMRDPQHFARHGIGPHEAGREEASRGIVAGKQGR